MRITCLIDNSVTFGSSLWGEHGLSFWIETPDGAVLWDTGASGTVLAHNLDALRLTGPIQAMALSHAHHDHTGGLVTALERFPGAPIYAHAELFTERFSSRGGQVRSNGMKWTREELEARTPLRLSAEPQELLPGVRTTGSIAPRPYPLGGADYLLVRREGQLMADDCADDLSLVLRVKGGIALLCGCCHAGLRNTLLTVRQQYTEPLAAILGGTHLNAASDDEIRALAAALAEEGAPMLYINHCTGERAVAALRATFGERVRACPAGTTLAL